MTSKATWEGDRQPLLADKGYTGAPAEEMFVQSSLYLPRRFVMVSLFFTCIGMLHVCSVDSLRA
jgi:hypothetical protein